MIGRIIKAIAQALVQAWEAVNKKRRRKEAGDDALKIRTRSDATKRMRRGSDE